MHTEEKKKNNDLKNSCIEPCSSFAVLMLIFPLFKDRVTFFRLETIFANFEHLMVLDGKVLNHH